MLDKKEGKTGTNIISMRVLSFNLYSHKEKWKRAMEWCLENQGYLLYHP
jgi:hypothetical protein